jgi:FMN phosphatase YigB (HAD superfamily)
VDSSPFISVKRPAEQGAGFSEISLRNIRGFIFDFDGTLYDYRLLPFRLIMENPMDLFRIWSERRTRKEFTGCDYGSPEVYYQKYFSYLGALCHKDGKTLQDWYFNRYAPRMVRVLQKYYTLRPGVKELFDRLNAALENATGSLRGIAAYSDYPLLRERMAALGLNPGKMRLYGPESFGAQKPARRPFTCIARDMGVNTGNVLVIGDREDTDGAGALNAGMCFLRLDDGRKRQYRMDPDRQPPEREEPHPVLSIPRDCGSWETICAMLTGWLRRDKNTGRDF